MLVGSQVDNALTMLTWNVLADRLAIGNFIRAPEACLVWESRFKRIVAELDVGLDAPPDVICLQEVDHYDAFAEALAARGYIGAFAPKSDDRDGCSLFVLRHRFRLEDVDTLRYRDPTTGRDHTQLALLATLVPPGGGEAIRVATTHLKAKEGNQELRRSQAEQLVEVLSGHRGPVVIGGDFNDVPGSPAYRVMSESFASAYAGLLHGEPDWTTWKVRKTGEVRRTIDYVWHSPELRPVSCLSIPDDDRVEPDRFPSMQYPSDHLSLVVSFAPAV